MASRINIYGTQKDPNIKRLKREMSAMYVEYDLVDPEGNDRAQRRLAEWGNENKKWPVVEVLCKDGSGSVFLSNPDEPTLRQCLYSEGIISVTSYWI